MRNASFVWLGAGVIAVGLGTYFGVRTLSTKSDRDRNCSPSCNFKGFEDDHEARALALDSTAWFAAGILATGVGATLFWVSRSGTHPARSDALRVTPFVGVDRAGAQLGGNW